MAVADLHSKILDAHPTPLGPILFFNFMQFLGIFDKIVGGLGPHLRPVTE